MEPNAWLVQDGILNETGEDLIRLKRPVFSHAATLAEFSESLQLDYAMAQSIFSHASLRILEGCEDYQGEKWVYPG